MRGLVVRELLDDFGGVSLEKMELPEPQAGEVRVKIRAASINFPDLLMTRGAYQAKPPLPFIPGLEFSGEVEKLGPEVSDWKIDDAVVGGNGIGGMAQYIIVPTSKIRRKPKPLSWEAAASYTTAYLTAYVAFARCGMVQPGEWVLVHGAAGGVGLAAVDLAKAMGARIIAVASSEEKRHAIQRLYDPEAVISSDAGFYQKVREITGGAGADVIYDPVGGDVFDESTRCIAFGGRLLVVGFASGRIATLASNIPLIKGFSVVGVRAGEYGRRFPDKGRENLEILDAWAADGRIQPHIDQILDLAEWRQGFDRMAQRKVIGKIVLRP